MSYDYMKQRAYVFSESGIKMFLTIRDRAKELLEEAGAFREQELHNCVSGYSWDMLACVDYLVERGEIRRIYAEGPRQYNIYTEN